MKIKKILTALFLSAFLSSSLINAQTEEINAPKEDSWKFALGVSVFSNRNYGHDIYEKQPIEVNFKYNIHGNHYITLSGIASFNNKLDFVPTNKNTSSMEEYLEMVTTKNYATYIDVDNYYDFYGGTIGYNYNYPIWKTLSVFGGAELGIYRQYLIEDYFKNQYYAALGKEEIELYQVYHSLIETKKDIFSLKPELGLQYAFRHLLFEAAISHPFTFTAYPYGRESVSIWSRDPEIRTYHREQEKDYKGFNFNQFVYKFSIFFTL